MENFTITKETAIASVKQSVSSIFSKEDVLYLLEKIEVVSHRAVTVTDINRAIDSVIDSLEREGDRVVDLSSAEFSMTYDCRVELESVGLDFDYIREALENNFMDFGEEDLSTFGPSEESEMK